MGEAFEAMLNNNVISAVLLAANFDADNKRAGKIDIVKNRDGNTFPDCGTVGRELAELAGGVRDGKRNGRVDDAGGVGGGAHDCRRTKKAKGAKNVKLVSNY